MSYDSMQEAFEHQARRLNLRPGDKWVGGYVDYEWEHLRHEPRHALAADQPGDADHDRPVADPPLLPQRGALRRVGLEGGRVDARRQVFQRRIGTEGGCDPGSRVPAHEGDDVVRTADPT